MAIIAIAEGGDNICLADGGDMFAVRFSLCGSILEQQQAVVAETPAHDAYQLGAGRRRLVHDARNATCTSFCRFFKLSDVRHCVKAQECKQCCLHVRHG